MTIIKALLLGILQGIAEFLPISSSGHLAIAEELFGLGDIPLIFDVLLHLATLFAVVLFFWKQIADLFSVLFRWITRKAKDDDIGKQKIIIAIILGTVVTGVIGIITSKFLPEIPTKFISCGFIITAFLLITSSWFSKKQIENKGSDIVVSPLKGLFIGFAQGIGTLPGISRSGITISASLFAGIDRKIAGEYSFILSIPAILGAFILEAKDLDKISSDIGILPLVIGCVAAFVTGLLALKLLMKLVNKGKLEYFAWYLIPVGILGFIFL